MQTTSTRVADALPEPDHPVLVLGGDCTVGIDTIAGTQRAFGDITVAYFDLHSDLNTPASAADGTLDWMALAHVIHLDVDVVDFTDAPLSEHPSRNTGLRLDEMLAALKILASGPGLAAITVAGLNPHNAAADEGLLERFAASFAGAMT